MPSPHFPLLAVADESWPWRHKSGRANTDTQPTSANEKAAPTSLLGSTLESTLLSGMQMSQPIGHKDNRADPLTPSAIWWHGLRKDALPALPLWQARQPTQG